MWVIERFTEGLRWSRRSFPANVRPLRRIESKSTPMFSWRSTSSRGISKPTNWPGLPKGWHAWRQPCGGNFVARSQAERRFRSRPISFWIVISVHRSSPSDSALLLGVLVVVLRRQWLRLI